MGFFNWWENIKESLRNFLDKLKGILWFRRKKYSTYKMTVELNPFSDIEVYSVILERKSLVKDNRTLVVNDENDNPRKDMFSLEQSMSFSDVFAIMERYKTNSFLNESSVFP